MTKKTTEAYLDVFDFIEQFFKLEPAVSMTDFEDGMRIAIRIRWPNCDLRGCEFHYKYAINRRCKADTNLKFLLENNANARKIKNMLHSIPLLPKNRILEGYKAVKLWAKNRKLHVKMADLFSYYERQWLCEVRDFVTLNKFIN